MKLIPLSILFIFLIGCANVSRLNDVSIDQTKNEAIKVMGEPDTIRANSNVEYLAYTLFTTGETAFCWGMGIISVGVLPAMFCTIDPNYYVKMKNDKVTSYGKIGDFDSTKDPVININQTNN